MRPVPLMLDSRLDQARRCWGMLAMISTAMKLVVPSLLISIPALTSEIPEPVIPAGVGVNIHFVRGHEKDLDMIAAGGFKFIRMDFGWAGIERKKGQYDWSAYDELTANLEKRGIRALYI